MKKYFRITWLVAFAVFVISALVMSAILCVGMFRTGLFNTYVDWCRMSWRYINTVMPMYGKVMFGGFIFFLITMFFVFRED